MTWLNRYARGWRTFILLLLILAFISPWGYERINVPAHYDCTPPFIRLEGDFCGTPLPGIWSLFVSFGLIFTTIAGAAEATFSLLLTRVLFSLLTLLTPLAILSSLFIVWFSGGQSWPQTRHLKILRLSVVGGFGFLLFVVLLPGPGLFYIWGAWAYALLALVALLLETVVWRNDRRFG